MRNRTVTVVFILALCLVSLCFTTTAYADEGGETLTVNAAWLDGEMIRINVTDANGVSSALALRLTDYVSDAENNEYISIQAVDLEGNKSGVIQVKNPSYVPPEEADNIPEADPIPSEPESPPQSESFIPDEGKLFTPDGTGTVMDNVTDGDGKEFFTVGTEDGSVFYLIIDRQRSSDNVYFLNAVTEDDLIALAQKNGKPIAESTSAIPSAEQETTTQQPTTTTAEPETKNTPLLQKSGFKIIGAIILVTVVIAAVGVAVYYFKFVKGKQNTPDDDYDMEFENDAEETNLNSNNNSVENETEDEGGGDV